MRWNGLAENEQIKSSVPMGRLKRVSQKRHNYSQGLKSQGCKELAHSLKMVHDLALYHSDIPFDTAEKSALFDVNLLVEGFQRMAGKV